MTGLLPSECDVLVHEDLGKNTGRGAMPRTHVWLVPRTCVLLCSMPQLGFVRDITCTVKQEQVTPENDSCWYVEVQRRIVAHKNCNCRGCDK